MASVRMRREMAPRVAELLDQEAALFFPSGTQANQTGIAVTVPRGRELVLEAGAEFDTATQGPIVLHTVKLSRKSK